jgi:hypothetical protein
MFEKEAEEYANKYVTEGVDELKIKVIKGHWQDGAEFGYNKANEWHYVKDGDLPKEDDVYLVYTTKGVLLGHYEQGGADGETNFKGEPYSDFTEYPSEMLFTEDEIIAWKEIVLPKESK